MSFEQEPELTAEEVEETVAETIADNEVALFMKGTPLMPQCGYSRKALKLIQQHREDVATVDVLQATGHFRAALEEHSGWETIPQVFVDGEFVGGSDVLEQLHDKGDLAETLSA
jgi:monothiol glutaredoxin